MGLFSSKKIINVSSTIYNLAGPEEDRPNYLKGTLFSSVMANNPSIADDITGSYFKGPGMRQRHFFRYADRNNLVGLPQTTITNTSSVDANAVVPFIPNPEGYEVSVQQAFISAGDPQPFLERWLAENHPEELTKEWVGDYDNGQFVVQTEDGTVYNFTDASFSTNKQYLEAKYYFYVEESSEPVETTPNGRVFSQADTTGWDKTVDNPSFVLTDLTRETEVVVSYNDGTPSTTSYEDSSLTDQEMYRSEETFERTVVQDLVGSSLQGEVQRYIYVGDDHVTNDYHHVTTTTENGPAGLIITTTRTTTGEQVTTAWDETYETQTVYTNEVVDGERYFIYEIGSGNATLDALATNADAQNYQEFYPFLPIRIDNKSITEAPYDTNGVYDETKKAYRRATDGESFSKLVDLVEDNDSIDDIDYAYMIYGVSLNARDYSARRYVQEYYKSMIPIQNSSFNAIDDLKDAIAAYEQWEIDYAAWQQAQNSESNWTSAKNTPPPVRPNRSEPPTTTIRLTAFNGGMGFDIRVPFIHVETEVINGTYDYLDPDNGVSVERNSKQGECLIVKGETVTWQERVGLQGRDETTYRYETHTIPSFEVYFQIDSDTYEKTTVWGALHQNYIYGGKSVKISSSEALDDDDESGFVVPLHYPTMKAMGIVDYTQMATANTHILFNSYTVTKQKWYQRGIFKILLVILVIVIAVVAFPGAFAAGGGILGGNLAIGTALGLTGTAALVAGVVANYIASIIISQLLSVVAVELFGEKWGAVFAAIASFALGVAMSGAPLFSAQNIFGFANALANGYAGYLQGEAMEMYDDMAEDREDYEKEMDRINDLIASLGGNDLNFNPMFFTDSARGNGGSGSGGYLPETADQFIQRTTMTGTDLVEITLAMVSDYAEIQRTLPKN
ncbi:hypothetical protein HYO99_gp67 [Roseobacter phage RD-1410W1-01]|uniref:Uncharacterized protein n=1 Tax=Roseobacter phage RD-1410W1-01 TaxID=1815984 RepID=A0A191VYL6_9CAUD|nr:hypothetical protein HYO99_gp67 [Roseobacter phage RD-1410W1-01]ANJ20801.1 hypothetical protein RDp01_gp67 [Roseobacter phage RD-1410W1-01]